MGSILVGHRCVICGSVKQSRAKAKKHVNHNHIERVSHRHGPGQHVNYIWLDLDKQAAMLPSLKEQRCDSKTEIRAG